MLSKCNPYTYTKEKSFRDDSKGSYDASAYYEKSNQMQGGKVAVSPQQTQNKKESEKPCHKKPPKTVSEKIILYHFKLS